MNTPEKIAEISGPVTKSQQQSLQNPITHTKRNSAKIKILSQDNKECCPFCFGGGKVNGSSKMLLTQNFHTVGSQTSLCTFGRK